MRVNRRGGTPHTKAAARECGQLRQVKWSSSKLALVHVASGDDSHSRNLFTLLHAPPAKPWPPPPPSRRPRRRPRRSRASVTASPTQVRRAGPSGARRGGDGLPAWRPAPQNSAPTIRERRPRRALLPRGARRAHAVAACMPFGCLGGAASAAGGAQGARRRARVPATLARVDLWSCLTFWRRHASRGPRAAESARCCAMVGEGGLVLGLACRSAGGRHPDAPACFSFPLFLAALLPLRVPRRPPRPAPAARASF